MKHVKRIGILVGACVPFASNAWYQEDLIKITNEKEDSIKIKIEKLYEHKYWVTVMVVCAKIDKESEINQNLIDKLNEHELQLNHA